MAEILFDTEAPIFYTSADYGAGTYQQRPERDAGAYNLIVCTGRASRKFVNKTSSFKGW